MVTVKLQGGIGNQMFQYAAAKVLALKNNTGVILDLATLNHRISGRNYVFRTYDLDLLTVKANLTLLSRLSFAVNNLSFLLSRLLIMVRIKLRPNSVIIEKENYSFDSSLLSHNDGVYLDGYWQSYKYFEGYNNEIRAEFKFKQTLSGNAKAIGSMIELSNSVAINIRRDDYVKNMSNLEFFGFMDKNYYNVAINIINSSVTDPYFFIFTDDLAWARNNFEFLKRKTIIGPELDSNRYVDKLHLMTLCKHFIIPNSTFAWWGAWLSSNPDKIVIAPKKWVTDPIINANTKDLIPEDWLRI